MLNRPTTEKQNQREQIRQDTNKFLASGGRIQRVDGQAIDYADAPSWQDAKWTNRAFRVKT